MKTLHRFIHPGGASLRLPVLIFAAVAALSALLAFAPKAEAQNTVAGISGTYVLGPAAGGSVVSWSLVVTPAASLTPGLIDVAAFRGAAAIGAVLDIPLVVNGTFAATWTAAGETVDFYPGTAGNDYIAVSRTVSLTLILAMDGNDTLYGGAGRDLIVAGGGEDYVVAGDENDTVWTELYSVSNSMSGTQVRGSGQTPGDIVYGGAGNDLLAGCSGVDELHGEDGTDTLVGDDDDDVLEGGDDGDAIDGGDGDNTIDGDDASDPYSTTITGNDVIVSGDGAGVIHGGGGNDTITCNSGYACFIEGGAGNDTISGGTAGDAIHGDDSTDPDSTTITGNDVIAGNGGNDEIWGGGGNDQLSGNDDDDLIHGNDGNDVIFCGAGNDGTYSVRVTGDAGMDDIWGGAGVDYIDGGASDDFIRGEAGDDFLYGGSADDCINGGDGVDYIEGGTGADWLHDNDATGGNTFSGGSEHNWVYCYNNAGGTNADSVTCGDDADDLWRNNGSPIDTYSLGGGTNNVNNNNTGPTGYAPGLTTAPGSPWNNTNVDAFEFYAREVHWGAGSAGRS